MVRIVFKVNGRDKAVIGSTTLGLLLFWCKVASLSEKKATILGNHAGLMKLLLSQYKAANRLEMCAELAWEADASCIEDLRHMAI